MRRLRLADVTAALLSIVVAVSACGAPAATGSGTAAPAGSGPQGSGLAGAGSFMPDPPAGLNGRALGTLEDELIERSIVASGGDRALGEGGIDILAGIRHEVLGALLEEGEARIAGHLASAGGMPAEPGPQPAIAELFGGNVLALTTYLSEQLGADNSSGSQNLETSDERDVEIEGHRTHVSTQASLTISPSGSRLTGDASLTMTAQVFDAQGNVVGTMTLRTTGKVEIDMCPAADGSIAASFDLQIETDASGVVFGGGGAGHTTFTTAGRANGTVGDDAYLQGYEIDSGASIQATNPGSSPVDRSVAIHAGYVLSGAAGDVGSIRSAGQATGGVQHADPDATDADINALLRNAVDPAVIVATLAFKRAQELWRGGACVKIASTETGRDVDPSEVVNFSARVVHIFEAADLDKPIVPKLSGVAQLSPADTEEAPPVALRYVAGSSQDDTGTVTLTSTSNRGIGTLAVKFRVHEPVKLDLVIDSTITIEKLNSFTSPGTKAVVSGRIRLDRDAAGDVWRGTGDLTSTTTTPGLTGCQQISVTGSGTYDWVVREAVVEPGLAATDIVVHMDAGPRSEQPDDFVANVCPAGTLTGKMNTWENLFFGIHRTEFKAKGFEVRGWTAGPGAATWEPGQTIATATWTSTCFVDPILLLVASCGGTTTFRLEAVSPP